MAKQVSFGRQAMQKMLSGLDLVADAVGGTIGPKGRNVYLDDKYQPQITNDGFTIATRISLADKQEDAGAYVIRNLAGQQNDDVGDGTTTVSVLGQAIIHAALQRPENPIEVKRSLQEAGLKVLKQLTKQAVTLKPDDVRKVALISAEDEGLADILADIFKKLGHKAVISVEDSKTFATEYETVDGYEAHVGFISPHFVTDKKAAKAVYTDVPVLVSERKLASVADLKPIFDLFNGLKPHPLTQCVIVCEDIDDSILGILAQNKLMGTFNSLVIRATGWLLKDIEGATGATAIGATNGISFAGFKPDYLGFAKKVVSTANTTIFTTDGLQAKKYAAILEGQANGDPNQYSQKKTLERVNKLRGGLAVLKVGGSTDFEREYLKAKADDSVKAVQAALAEGIVEGGGMALWRIAQTLTGKTIGEQVLKTALQAPLRKIIDNAGKDYTEVISRFRGNEDRDLGYDAKNDCLVDMLSAGIIDPVKVTRCALENAVSSAATFITTFCVITEAEEAPTKEGN